MYHNPDSGASASGNSSTLLNADKQKKSLQSNRFSAQKAAIPTDFAAFLASDPRPTPCDKVLMLAIAAAMNARGRWRGTDEELATAASMGDQSVRGSLSHLADLNYLETLGRKCYGERDLVLHSRFSSKPSKQKSSKRNAIGDDNCAVERNIGTLPVRDNKYKETPDQESLSKNSLNLESLNTNENTNGIEIGNNEQASLDSEFLANLASHYGAEHYPPQVVEAAMSLRDSRGVPDLAGLPRYNNIWQFVALEDEDVWQKALRRTHSRWKAGNAPTPRSYMETTVLDVLAEVAQAQADRARFGVDGSGADTIPDTGPCTEANAYHAPYAAHREVKHRPVLTDYELDALIANDPFADDAHNPISADPEPPAEPAAPIYAPAVLDAAKRLNLQDKIGELQAVLDGVCKSHAELFAMCVKHVELAGVVKSPIAFMCKVAQDNQGKDAQWLRDRAQGLSAADCMRLLVAWEEALEAEKEAHNQPVTGMGGFRADSPVAAGFLMGGILGAVTGQCQIAQALAALALPASPQEWEEQEQNFSQMRPIFADLLPALQDDANKAGRMLADSKSEKGTPKWEQWRRLGVYHAVVARHDEITRKRNIAAARDAGVGDGEDNMDGEPISEEQ